MQFSNFSRLEEGLTIFLYNEIPIENVEEIKYYIDNLIGNIVKKEFRWSFNNEYWSAWEELTQSAISRINIFDNFYLFLQIRYTLSAIGSGNVTSFTLNYKENDIQRVKPRIFASDIQKSDASAVIIHDILQKYEVTKITDASTLHGNGPRHYLNRSNHFGTQPINSIEDLQNILTEIYNNLPNGFTGSFTSDGSIVNVERGIIISII